MSLNKFVEQIIHILLKNSILFFCLSILLLLLARNPFSLRTLIPVLDPFPDSIHYTNSAFSLLKGKGFVVEREGMSIQADVPPLYSLTLLPSFLIFHDVRTFYFTNVFLSIAAFLLFYRLVRLSFTRKRIQLLVLLSYLICLPLSWYTTLPMAENLILPLFLVGLNLMVEDFTFKKSLLMAVVSVCFYATKYASIPLLFAFAFLYFLKIWLESFEISGGNTHKSGRLKNSALFILSLALFVGIFEIFEYTSKGTGIITQIIPLFLKVFVPYHVMSAPSEVSSQNVFFSTVFIYRNLTSYLGWLVGGVIYILWMPTRILSPIFAVPSFIGLFLALTQKKWRGLALSLIISLAAVLLFMMSFYTTDGRYFWNAVPTIFLGFGFFLSLLEDILREKFSFIASAIVFMLIGVVILIQNFSPVKSAIMLNLRHAETPWPYISILRLNTYLKDHPAGNAVIPVVITPLSPYYVDYFRTEKVILLPLDQKQEARSNDQLHVYGKYDFTDLHKVYADFIRKGVPVYFASYGIGNDKDMRSSQQALSDDFALNEVDSGCENVCNLYQLQLKK